MQNYHALLAELLTAGLTKEDRTGTGTLSLFARQLRYPLGDGFPLLTTKRVHFASVAHELLWFLRGESNIAYLKANNVSIWDEWADAAGELGPVYGVQWRSWPLAQGGQVDQIAQVVEAIRTTPDSRRLIVSAWNVGQLSQMALPPCHLLFQFYVGNGKLSCQLYQRSADAFLGLPFNIASYALLTHMVAQVTLLEPGELIITLGDVHLYRNHIAQAQQLLEREHKALPTLRLNPAVKDIFAFTFEDFMLENYQPHPTIKAQVAV